MNMRKFYSAHIIDTYSFGTQVLLERILLELYEIDNY